MNYYAKVIGLMAEENDWKRIVVSIAKIHPKAVVNAIEADGWEAGAKELLISEGKIAAIKYCREITGWGLRESKLAVENL